jgi:spermidine synthase
VNIRTTFAITFIVSFCSIVYELLLAQTLSTVLGNTVLRYSLTIGFYLAAKGVGAMLCSARRWDSVRTLLRVEMALITVGGLSVILINIFDVIQKYIYASSPFFQKSLFLDGCIAEIIFFVLSQSVIIAIGILSGFEIPLLIDIAEREKSGTTNMILGVDYFGSLAGSILFPLVLLPILGIFSISFATAILNGLAGLGIIYFKRVSKKMLPVAATILLSALLILGFSRASDIKQFYLKKFYFDSDIQTVSDIFKPSAFDRPPIEHWESPYQHIELISANDSFDSMLFYHIYSKKWVREPDYPNNKWLFMNSKFQFFSLIDEIYHEYFVHIPIILTQIPKKVCILGGGDGLVARELLKYSEIREIYQVELDPKIIEIAKNHPVLLKMNKGAFHNPRLKIFSQDAFFFIQHNKEKFDAIYIDFPTPNDYNLSILYSQEFYSFIRRNLKENGFAAMDMPSGELFDEDSNFQIYYSTVKSSGFRKVFPISSILEADNQRALELLNEEYIAEEIDAVDQQFLFMTNSTLPLNRTFKYSGIELYVLNDKRFKLAFPPFPDQVIPSLVNSIFKPTLPDFYLFDINYPF